MGQVSIKAESFLLKKKDKENSWFMSDGTLASSMCTKSSLLFTTPVLIDNLSSLVSLHLYNILLLSNDTNGL